MKVKPVRILGICGSLREGSYNRQLLLAAAQLLPDEVEFSIFEGLSTIPPFNEDDEASPAAPVLAWREAILAADALIFATPEYNYSIPGQLKNAVDWASRPTATAALLNKPTAVIGASTSLFGAVWAQAELRKSLAAAGARVGKDELPVAMAAEAFKEDGTLLDDKQEIMLCEILFALLSETKLSEAFVLGKCREEIISA
jgi:chromate reductase